MSDEVRLPEGASGIKVWRSSRGVHRETGPWTATVHSFLRHLESVAFDAAPRVLGTDDEGRELLTFIEGEVLADPAWRPGRPTPWPAWAQSEACLVASARLLRQLHDAARSFVIPEGATWRQHDCPALGRDEIVCHGDVGPHNTVYRDGAPVAFIDWDAIRPIHPLVEFGSAAWHYVPLGSDDYFAQSGFGARPDLADRLALFAREYGVTTGAEVAWALHQGKQRMAELLKFFPISAGEGAAGLRQIAADLDWLHCELDALVAHLD